MDKYLPGSVPTMLAAVEGVGCGLPGTARVPDLWTKASMKASAFLDLVKKHVGSPRDASKTRWMDW
eukprot:9745607-Prorocentrum_lima.AAC.1